MIEIQGLCNAAVCFCDELEDSAARQIRAVCDMQAFANCKIRIMPDVHAGKGCTIGMTMTIRDKIVPAMVGVDIGCGMETVKLAEKNIDFEKLDALIRKNIPCGRNIRKTPHAFTENVDLNELRCASRVGLERAEKSVGTLGGGNHFIEIDRAENGDLYLVVHSGSRHLGVEVCDYYQDQGFRALQDRAQYQIDKTIERLKSEGRFEEIQTAVGALKKQRESEIPKELVYVEGKLFENYIYDMRIVQKFADINRKAMTQVILRGMGLTAEEEFSTVHNYVDTEEMILRKGSVSAKKGEKLLIPVNMRDGSFICIGKGNPEWNCSAPHGAGRVMSRKKANETLSMEEYRREMQGVYSSCIAVDTLDESPMAYKSMDSILAQIGPSVDVVCRIVPVYNFKASE